MKKIIILSSLFLVFLTSCNCTETHLTQEEREWFSVYNKGQTIIFKSNLGNLDTLVVTEKNETFGNKECNWIEIGTIQNNMLNLLLKPKKCKNEANCEVIIAISKDKIDEKALPFFRLFDLEYTPASVNNELLTKSIKLLVTGKSYVKVYSFEDGVNAKGYGNNYLKSFYWDKEDGLIRYDAHDGEVFELFKKIK